MRLGVLWTRLKPQAKFSLAPGFFVARGHLTEASLSTKRDIVSEATWKTIPDRKFRNICLPYTVDLSLVSYCAHTVQFPQWKENVTTRRTIGSDFHNGFAKDVNEGLSKILGGHFETFFERVKKI